MFKLISVIFFAAIAQIEPPEPENVVPPESEEQELTLDPVIKEGRQFGVDLPQTGKLLFRPILYAQSRNDLTTVRTVEFTFAPVELIDAGTAVLYTEQERTRFKVLMRVPVDPANAYASNIRKRIKADAYKPKAVNLPGGVYVLSEIRYTAIDTIVDGGGTRGTLNTSNIRVIDSTRTIKDPKLATYCLSEGTFLFEVENGASQYLGAVAIADLPPNEARWRKHTPIRALDRNRSELNGRYADRDDIEDVALDAIRFEDSDGICTQNAFRVSAWRALE